LDVLKLELEGHALLITCYSSIYKRHHNNKEQTPEPITLPGLIISLLVTHSTISFLPGWCNSILPN